VRKNQNKVKAKTKGIINSGGYMFDDPANLFQTDRIQHYFPQTPALLPNKHVIDPTKLRRRYAKSISERC